jgi:hypothetical protein
VPSLNTAVFFGFSKGGINGFVLGVSAPIWLQVCASSANGLFFASNCKKAHGIPILHYKCDHSSCTGKHLRYSSLYIRGTSPYIQQQKNQSCAQVLKLKKYLIAVTET